LLGLIINFLTLFYTGYTFRVKDLPQDATFGEQARRIGANGKLTGF